MNQTFAHHDRSAVLAARQNGANIRNGERRMLGATLCIRANGLSDTPGRTSHPKTSNAPIRARAQILGVYFAFIAGRLQLELAHRAKSRERIT
jgi:hypothetical protein